jgi:hypothetical protein
MGLLNLIKLSGLVLALELLSINQVSACDNSHVNTLNGATTKTVSGWSFDPMPKYGPFNPQEPFSTQCKNSSWYGWDYPGDLAISTVLNGNGVASLKYGNCLNHGKVAVYLNDVEISSASPMSQGCAMSQENCVMNQENAIFSFHDQDVLKIVEHDGIIQYNDFNIINCSRCAQYGVNYDGNDIESGHTGVGHWMDCAAKCRNDRRCRYWTYTINQRKCYLKSSNSGEKVNHMAISGDYECVHECEG